MITIRLLDARRGLNRKCEELFGDAKIAELIYRYLCDGIEECDDAEPERTWIPVTERLPGKHRSAIVTDFGHVTLAYTNNLGEWMDYDGNKLKNVTAWMPLPEPYRDADMR